MYVHRKIEKDILKYIESKSILETLLISGARQTGKSSVIQHLMQNHSCLFLNLYESAIFLERLDQTQSFEEFEQLLSLEYNFTPNQGRLLVIDEAQESKKLGRWIRFFKEKWPGQKVIILGSILSRLFEAENNYPVGRVMEYTLRPFNFHEFLQATGKKTQSDFLESYSLKDPWNSVVFESLQKSYLEYLRMGGMPNIVLRAQQGQNPSELIEQLIRQYSLDIARHLGENFRSVFLSSLQRMSDLTCQPIKNSEIISSNAPFYRKLPQLLETLEKWHLLFRLPLMTKTPESRGAYSSKKYLFDVGLTSFFLNRNQKINWQERSPMENSFYGKVQENFVLNELISNLSKPEAGISFFKETKNSQEIDFIYPRSDFNLPIEVKSQTSINRNSLKPMINYLELAQKDNGVLIYNGPPTVLDHKAKQIIAIPPFLVSEIGRLVFSLP